MGGAAGGFLLFAATKFFEQRHRPVRGLAHVEIAKSGQLDDFACGRHADHRVAVLAPSLQVAQDRQEVVFQKEHAGDHDICFGDVRFAAIDQVIVAGVFRCRMQAKSQTRIVLAQGLACPLDRTREVGIHRHDHDVDWGRVWSLRFSPSVKRISRPI